MNKSDLKGTFLAFREQCIWLQTCFNTYAALYESGEGTHRVMSTSAPIFFDELNLILVEYCLLQVCRLTDSPRTAGRDNLTVTHINKLLKAEDKLTSEISAASDALAHYRGLIRDSRNWIISHADKHTVLAGLPIGQHNQEEVSTFFDNLYRYVDAVGDVVGIGPLDFRTTSGSGDALDLLRLLNAGLDYSPVKTQPRARMDTMRISKLEAAQRQLNFAIRLMFTDGDPVAVHTLVGAASILFSDLVDQNAPQRSWDKLAQQANSLSPSQFFQIMRKAQNFFKHAKDDPGATLEFDPTDTESLAFWAVMNASDLASISIEAQVFQLWYIASHSPTPDVNESPLREAIQLVGDLRNIERTERLRAGARALTQSISKFAG